MKPLDRKIIKNHAEKIVQEHGISSFPINPTMIAENNRIDVEPKNDCLEGISGVLIKVGDRCGIGLVRQPDCMRPPGRGLPNKSRKILRILLFF
jgi:hypothetical protein